MIGQYCQQQRCKHVESEQFWHAFASRGFVSDSWAFLYSLLDQSYSDTKSLFSFKNKHFHIFRQPVSAASCKPSAYGEHVFYVGLGCWRSYQVLGQWGKQWIGCLQSAPEGDGRVAPVRSSCRYWSIWSCIVAQVYQHCSWLSADPDGNDKIKSKHWNACFFPTYVIIFVLKSLSFQLILRFVRCNFRLYFVSVLLNISVSLFVSVNEIISISVSVSISVSEYITAEI